MQVLPQVWTLYKLMLSKEKKVHSSQGNQRPICCKQGLYMLVTSPYVATHRNAEWSITEQTSVGLCIISTSPNSIPNMTLMDNYSAYNSRQLK